MWTTEKADSKLVRGLLILITLLGAYWLGYLASTGAFNVQTIVILVAGLITLTLLFSGERGLWILLCAGIASIAFGHRGVYIGRWTYFVPMQVIVWLVFAVLVANSTSNHERLSFQLPASLVLVTLWSMVRASATWLGLLEGGGWDHILAWTSPFVLGFPTFWIVNHLLKRDVQLILALRILMVVSLVMSMLALLEFYLPSVVKVIPGFFSGELILAQDGFVRAPFSFWGYPAAASIVTWGVLIAYDELSRTSNSRWRWFAMFTFLPGVVAVYVSGQRSSWLALGSGLLLLTLAQGLWAILCTIVALIGVGAFLPSTFWKRLGTAIAVVRHGVVIDTSEASRLARWDWAYESILRAPLVGEGYSHWQVHNSFLEIGSSIGLLPAIAFLVFIVQLVRRISRAALSGLSADERRYGWLFGALALTWITQMLVETVLRTPPFAAAHWIMMALGWYLPDVFSPNQDHSTGLHHSLAVEEDLS